MDADKDRIISMFEIMSVLAQIGTVFSEATLIPDHMTQRTIETYKEVRKKHMAEPEVLSAVDITIRALEAYRKFSQDIWAMSDEFSAAREHLVGILSDADGSGFNWN